MTGVLICCKNSKGRKFLERENLIMFNNNISFNGHVTIKSNLENFKKVFGQNTKSECENFSNYLDNFEKNTPDNDSYELEIKKSFNGMIWRVITKTLKTIQPEGTFKDIIPDNKNWQSPSINTKVMITLPDFIRNIIEKIKPTKIDPQVNTALEDIYNKYNNKN